MNVKLLQLRSSRPETIMLNEQRCSSLFPRYCSTLATQPRLFTLVETGGNCVDRITMSAIVNMVATDICYDHELKISILEKSFCLIPSAVVKDFLQKVEKIFSRFVR